MKIKISDFKDLIREGYKELLEFRSVRNIKILDQNGAKQIINLQDGQVLVKDASNLKYKDYLRLFKELGIESVQVDRFGEWLKPGEYPRRVFLNKLAQFEGLNIAPPTQNAPIIQGVPTENFYKNVYSEILKERLTEENPKPSSVLYRETVPASTLAQIKHEAQRYMEKYSHMFGSSADFDTEAIVDRVSRFVMQYLKLDMDAGYLKNVILPLVQKFSSIKENKKK